MRPIHLIGAVVLIGVCAAAVMAFVLRTDDPVLRQPGGDLRGHWFAERAGGCFSDSMVFTVYDGIITGMWRGKETTFYKDVTFDFTDSVVVQTAEIPRLLSKNRYEWVPVEFKYRDEGDRLVAMSGTVDGEPADPLQTTLVQCGNFSLWGRISLLWRSPFQPGASAGPVAL